MSVKYPQVNVKLVGEDGNAFSVLGRCQKAARRAGVPKDGIKEFMDEAMSGDYDKLLQTVMKYFETDSEPEDENDY